ncbi:oxidoreductase [Neoroseomonas soli]|uniref:FAD-dependent oxidoreductase n=1 Tax=Neoroseomonas soli TaxID=1081025 RepID=A0A9X9WWV6_9PROT|nr:FAD-dependent oxidoreductase [Neoroseomonas soli]MBR0671635.1 FAD-dependent oxidoreductase [Neoroseomonas soli]
MTAEFPHVQQPLRVGGLTFRNRILVPAHTTNFGHDHMPSERHLHYHLARARGGVGAIIFESIRVHRNSLGRPPAVCGFDPACIEPFRRIVTAVQAEGAKILGQIIHLGRHIDGDFERTVSWGASAIPWTTTAAPPRPMDLEDMAAATEGHVVTARNLVAAGFDGIELQIAHGHLLQQFLSPLSNQRTDEFGGSLENRMRFPLAVLRAVREAVGRDYCLGIRVSGDEYVEGGLHLDEMLQVVTAMAQAVKVDFVNVSHAAYHGSYSLATQIADMAFDVAPFRELPRAIRATLRGAGFDTPVFAVCRFDSLAQAEATLAAGDADAIGMARAHIAEPALVRKTLEGRAEEIRPCIACNQGCAGMLEKNVPIRCLVNPMAGMEGVWAEPAHDRAAQPKRVLVVGGGPAGLEAAGVAAARGHRVTLWEAGARLGGQLAWLEGVPKRREFLRLVEAQTAVLARHGVQVETGRTATVEAIAAFGADQVVLATGSVNAPSPVSDAGLSLTLEEATEAPERLGTTIAVHDLTGEFSTLGLVEYLADLGRSVTVFTPAAAFAWRTTIYSTLGNLKRLRERKVRLALLRKVHRWDGARLSVEDVSTGEVEDLPGFTGLVVARHRIANDGLLAELKALGVPVKPIGDCLAPRTALEAVYQGHELARAI